MLHFLKGEICAASVAELVASVVGGEDGCFVSLGYCSAGKYDEFFSLYFSCVMIKNYNCEKGNGIINTEWCLLTENVMKQ